MRSLGMKLIAAASVALVGLTAPMQASASRWEIRKEMREGAKSVQKEKREAARELRKCKTRECARREVREGYREVERERREARREVRREIREDYYDRYYRGDNRWYRDGRYWDRYEYERRYYRRRDDDGNQFLKGAVVGAAVIGIAAAVANADDD
jgi:gas vesicle protein